MDSLNQTNWNIHCSNFGFIISKYVIHGNINYDIIQYTQKRICPQVNSVIIKSKSNKLLKWSHIVSSNANDKIIEGAMFEKKMHITVEL